MDEEWDTCEELPDYSVSSFGRFEDLEKERLVPTRFNEQGIRMVTLKISGKQKTRSVALLVAHAFVPPTPFEWFNSVIHLNGDKEDCRAMNLMWRSRPFALQYHEMFNDEPYRVSVTIPSTGEFFYSLREACTTYGLVEKLAYTNLCNGETCFPYNWIMERAQE